MQFIEYLIDDNINILALDTQARLPIHLPFIHICINEDLRDLVYLGQ